MKQVFTFTLIVSFFVLMLCFPQITFSGASRGLLLWFQVLLPTLLPFMILSNLLIRTNSVFYISRFLKPFFKRVFHISDASCYVVFVGFLCGYPLGAKTAADCVRLGQISKEEGQYLLSFANNSSLMYIISFLVMQTFKDASLTFSTIAILFASPILCSFFFRRRFIKHSSLHSTAVKPSSLTLHFHILDDSIMNSFEALTKIGGYVILFSILFSMCATCPLKWICPLLEITNGTTMIVTWNLPISYAYPLILGLTSFGGICSTAQTYGMIQGCNLSIKRYIIQKLITATVTSFLAYVYILFIH